MKNYSDLASQIEDIVTELISKCEAHDELAFLSYLLHHAKIEAKDRKMDAQ